MLLRSDYSGIEYEIEDDQIICISVKSKFPYLRVLCPHETESIRDADGNIIEIIDTYTMAANLSLLGRNAVSMKLDIETSDDVAFRECVLRSLWLPAECHHQRQIRLPRGPQKEYPSLPLCVLWQKVQRL